MLTLELTLPCVLRGVLFGNFSPVFSKEAQFM